MVQLWVTCVLCAVSLAFKTPLFSMVFLSALKCDYEILTYVLTCLDCEEWLLFKTIHMKKKMKQLFPIQWKLQLNLPLTTLLQ